MVEVGSRTVSHNIDSRRSPDSILRKTSFIIDSHRIPTKKSNSKTSCIGSSSMSSGKRSDRNSQKSKQPRLLQQVLCNREERTREMEVDLRLESVESSNQKGKIQDGVHRDNSQSSAEGVLGDINRPIGCVLSHPSTSELQEVHEILCGQTNISVQSISNGTDFFTQNLHKSDQVYKENSTATQHSPVSVSRRLASRCTQSGGGSTAHRVHCSTSTETGVYGEYQEVGAEADTGDYISGVPLFTGPRNSKAITDKMGENEKTVTKDVGIGLYHSRSVAEHCRPAVFSGETSTSRNASHSTTAVGSQRAMVTIQGNSVGSDMDIQRGERDYQMVVERGKCVEGNSHQSNMGISQSSSDLLRQQYSRLGRYSGRSSLERRVVSSRENVSHKLSGTVSNLEVDDSFRGVSNRKMCHDFHRQYNCNVLPQETGRHKIQGTERSSMQHDQLVSETQNNVQVQVHCREEEHCSRSVIEEESDTSNRMVPQSKSSGQSLGNLGKTCSGHVCDTVQPQTSKLCISSARSYGNGDRCSINQLEQNVCVCLSSNSHSRTGDEEGTRRRVHFDTSSTLLAETDMVSGHNRSADRLSSENPNHSKVTTTAAITHIPQSGRDAPTSCVESIQRSLQKKGFSSRAAKRMAESQKSSTRDLYQRKWDIFVKWCKGKEADPYQASIPLIADFLCELHEKKEYVISTIEGYRTAISHVLKAEIDLDVGNDPHLKSLIANFARDSSRTRTMLPKWDLALVLNAMTKEPFEPLKKVPMMMCTLKAVFLFTLATGKRRGEVHAILRSSLKRDEKWKTISVAPDISFIAKTELANRGCAVLKEIEIKALGSFLGQEMEDDYTLCPVRALRIYLSRSDEFRSPSQKKLFISVKENHDKDISKATVSGWLKKAVSIAYAKASPETQRLFKVKAHDVRAISSSWAFFKNVAMENIMQACSWKAHNTFTNFYLRDLSRIQGEMLSLGPIVVAQQTV